MKEQLFVGVFLLDRFGFAFSECCVIKKVNYNPVFVLEVGGGVYSWPPPKKVMLCLIKVTHILDL